MGVFPEAIFESQPTTKKRGSMMNIISRRYLLKWALPLVVTFLAVAGSPKSARASGSAISGTLSTHLVACATLCTSGTISGDLSGSFDYTMATMTATSEPNVFILTGSFVVTNATGTLFATDTTLWDVSTGQFTDMGKFRGGTGGYNQADGKITIVGVFDIVAGTGQSTYTGHLDTQQ
jgi:hypothetical protein